MVSTWSVSDPTGAGVGIFVGDGKVIEGLGVGVRVGRRVEVGSGVKAVGVAVK